jgi:glutathione synthase/RimK-type ligase-like ATP-grasp enzyme
MVSDAGIWILTDPRYVHQRMPDALVAWLCAAARPPRVVVAGKESRLSAVAPLSDDAALSAWSEIRPGDLVVARTRDPFALALLEEAQARGARLLDDVHAVHRVRNKMTCALALARRGLPVPATLLARAPEDLSTLPDSAFPLVVKPVLGDNARGVRIVGCREEIEDLAWHGELHLAQAYVDAGGFDIKLYVAGAHVWATRRPSPLRGVTEISLPVEVTPALRRIAVACREAFGLRLMGVDVLESEQGLSIVDVNEFPNYTGVADAPAAIGELVLAEAVRMRPDCEGARSRLRSPAPVLRPHHGQRRSR